MAKRKGLPVLSNKGRKVQATTRTSGLFTTGNKRSNNQPMGNLGYTYKAQMYGTPSSYEHPSNSAFGRGMPSNRVLDDIADRATAGLSRAQTAQASWGGLCAGCNTKMSRTGKCFCS